MAKDTDTTSTGTLHVEGESWKAYPLTPLYNVSTWGRILSCRTGTILRQRVNIRSGYLQVDFNFRVAGKRVKKTVHTHQVVMLTFRGATPPRKEICHYDGNKRNPKLANLRFGTRVENNADKRRHGTLVRGSACHQAKLNELRVRQLKADFRRGGVTMKQLGDRYGVADNTISRIISGRIWTHVR